MECHGQISQKSRTSLLNVAGIIGIFIMCLLKFTWQGSTNACAVSFYTTFSTFETQTNIWHDRTFKTEHFCVFQSVHMYATLLVAFLRDAFHKGWRTSSAAFF